MDLVFEGIQFRSRLEAAWHKFFDVTESHPQYEPECVTLRGAGDQRANYLPDFRLTLRADTPPVRLGCFAEIKAKVVGEEEDIAKACVLAMQRGTPTLIVVGNPLKYSALCLAPPFDRLGILRGHWVRFYAILRTGDFRDYLTTRIIGDVEYSEDPRGDWLSLSPAFLNCFAEYVVSPDDAATRSAACLAWNATQWHREEKGGAA